MNKLAGKFSLSLSLSLLIVSILTGFVAGQIIRSNSSNTEAASANIIVTDNNQVTTQDQSTSTQTITRTSTVTIKDSSATAGYTLSARLSQNTIPNSTVTIGSGSSSICALASPCTLTTTTRDILTTDNSNATGAAGDTTNWTVTITVPANTAMGNYILDIEYNETNVLIDPMQGFSVAQCNALADGEVKRMYDTRDGKIYRVKKMIDGRCWMIENLAFQLNNASAPTYSPAAALVANQSSVNNAAQYAANATAYNTAAGQTTYLYNWCAALGDTSSNCSASVSAASYDTVISGTLNTTGTATTQPDVQGICPAPFRLPKGGPSASSSNAATTANEFAKLDIAMGGTGANRASANTYPLFTGTATTNTNWSGVLSGVNSSGIRALGNGGYWWSSTANSSPYAYNLSLLRSSSYVYPADFVSYKDLGFAVRCVL